MFAPRCLRPPRQEFAPNNYRQNVIRIGKIAFINFCRTKHRIRIAAQSLDQLGQGMNGLNPDMP